MRSAAAMARPPSRCSSSIFRCSFDARTDGLFLLDVSHSLLNTATGTAAADAARHPHVPLIHGSFLDLPKLPMLVNPLRGRTRLFAMLGYTWSTLSDELRFFRDTLSCCEPGELFLFDIQIARPQQSERQKILKLDPIGNSEAATYACELAEQADSSLLPRR